MTTIIRATAEHAALLSGLAVQTFWESHGHSAPPADIDSYAARKYTEEALAAELADPRSIYHLIYEGSEAAGFSKIILDEPCAASASPHLTKLERLYLLRAYYQAGLGKVLFTFLVDLSRQHGQQGMWLYVWQKNARALAFYTRQGFQIVGHHDFPISATHSNPNYQMLLVY